MIFTINIYHYNIIISTISVKTSSLFSDTELKCYHVEGKTTAVCYVMWSECEIGDGCRPEGYTMKEVHAVFVFAGLKKKLKPQVEITGIITVVFYFLCWAVLSALGYKLVMWPFFTENEACESRLVQSEMFSDDNNEMVIRT